MKPLKTALCFAGTCRSLQYTYQNIRDKLIDPLGECDIFVYGPENPHAHKAQELIALPQVKDAIIEPEPEYDLSNYVFRPGWPPAHQSTPQTYIRMVKSREKFVSMIGGIEQKNGLVYDRVIFSRLDVVYYSDVSRLIDGLDLTSLSISDFHNTYGGDINGVNDRFAVGNRENMNIYFSVLRDVDKFMAQTPHEAMIECKEAGVSLLSGQRYAGQLHAETLLKWHLNHNGVNVRKIPLRFSRVRIDGEAVELDRHLKSGPIPWNET